MGTILNQVKPIPMQVPLFDAAKVTAGFRDPAFTKNREVPLHRWVPWVAGFSAQFVQDCLQEYLPESDPSQLHVLDPFAGVGTTLLEAYTHGLNVVGFEINPFAALAARSKLEAPQVSPGLLSAQIEAFEKHMNRRCGPNGEAKTNPCSQPPPGFSGRTRLFSPKVERKVLIALDFINCIDDRKIRDLFRLAFGSVMVGLSNYSYEPSLTRRSAVGKADIYDAPVARVISSKLTTFLDDILWLRETIGRLPRSPQAKMLHANFFSAPELIDKTEFVDLIVTSPPYLNNYHYPRNTRPQLHWLRLTSGTGYGGARENDSFGKFWQTVRSLPAVPLAFSFPALQRIIDEIRELNTAAGTYGGRGWANYVATYFNDTHRFCRAIASLLRPGGTAVIVLGNSVIQGTEVKTDQFFGEIAERCGLTFLDTRLLRNKRTGSSIIRSSVRVDRATTKTVLYESAIILRK
jgi:DNA modification methylase